jgi:hypothetical protein
VNSLRLRLDRRYRMLVYQLNACLRAYEDHVPVEGLDESNEPYAIHKIDRHAGAIRTHRVQKSILF